MSRKKYRDFDDDHDTEEVDVNEVVEEEEEYDGYVLEDEDDVKELNFED